MRELTMSAQPASRPGSVLRRLFAKRARSREELHDVGRGGELAAIDMSDRSVATALRIDGWALQAAGELALASQPVVPYLLSTSSASRSECVVGESVTRVLGYSLEAAAVGGWWLANLHPEDASVATQRRAAALAGGPSTQTYRFRCADGDYRTLTDQLRVIAGGATHGRAIGILTDITPRPATDDGHAMMLRQAQKGAAIGELASGIAHDFNNVLTAIRAYCDLVIEDLGPRHRLVADVTAIATAARHATSLVRQLLGLSRPQAPSLGVMDVNAVISEFEGMLQRMIRENIRLSLSLDPGAGRIVADRGLVEQVLLNLVANARDAMPNGGRVSIRTEGVHLGMPVSHRHGVVPPGGYTMIEVEDTGCGMDEGTQQRVFDAYFTTKEPGKGTGLGLSTTYGILKQCRGHIVLTSEPGRGTRFRLYHPQTDRAPTPDRPDQALADLPRGHETILLVEDNPSVLEPTRALLDRSGYRVLTARSGDEAMRIASTCAHPIDLLLTDVAMPEMNGDELGARMRSVNPRLRIVYMTGYSGATLLARGASVPAMRIIEKPFSSSDLLHRIRHVLQEQAGTRRRSA
jgi:two-component system cell cycle sensor histidine kinase/response regulator CckA